MYFLFMTVFLYPLLLTWASTEFYFGDLTESVGHTNYGPSSSKTLLQINRVNYYYK